MDKFKEIVKSKKFLIGGGIVVAALVLIGIGSSCGRTSTYVPVSHSHSTVVVVGHTHSSPVIVHNHTTVVNNHTTNLNVSKKTTNNTTVVKKKH